MSANNLVFYDFSGGINTSQTSITLGYGAKKLFWDDSYNVELHKNQGVKRMLGNQTFLINEENAKVIAICEYPKSTEGFLYVLSDGKVKHYDYISRTESIIYDWQKEIDKADFTLYLNGIVIFAPQCTAVFYNEKSEEKVKELGLKNASGDIVYPECAATFAGRIWVGAESVLYYSALGRFDDWESADDAGYIANFHSSTSKISALATYCGNLAIFKEDGVYLLSGSSPANFSVVKFADKGVSGSKALCTCNNKQYFLNADGLFSLSQVGELSQIMMSGNIAHDIKNSFEKIDRSRIAEAFCVPYEKNNQIWFYIPYNNDEYFKTILVYDFLNNCWTKRIETQNITSAASVFGEIMSGTQEGTILIENVSSTFDGEAIKFKFSTPFFHLGKPSERKIVEDFALLLDDADENSFKFSVSKDFVKENKTDIEYIKTTQENVLIWADKKDTANSNNCWSSQSHSALWARSYETSLGVQIFDSNVSVAIHIEGEKPRDNFKLVGIEFKELLDDE